MSKYNKLFEYFKNNNQEDYTLSFKDIQNITDNKIDHLFLKYKKAPYLHRHGASTSKNKT